MADAVMTETQSPAENPKPKTERELAKERAKAEKLAKFAEKQKKLKEEAALREAKEQKEPGGKKAKAKGKETITEYHWRTKAGEKKGLGFFENSIFRFLICFFPRNFGFIYLLFRIFWILKFNKQFLQKSSFFSNFGFFLIKLAFLLKI